MANYLDKKFVQQLLPYRDDNANKGSFGKILNISGSRLYSGAAFLSSKSALKIGAGYVTLACPNEVIARIAPSIPELTYLPLEEDSNGAISENNSIKNMNKYNVISLGCGLTTNVGVQKFLINTLKELTDGQKLVLDADALNIIALHKEGISFKKSIITPHPMELSRLLNVEVSEIIDNREKYARITSQTFECITVLKGHQTIITDGEKIYKNTTGNSALAKAGSGDVLTGIISGLLAQKVKPINSAILGVYLHGLSGDICSSDLTKYSVLASDVIEYLPKAISTLLSGE